MIITKPHLGKKIGATIFDYALTLFLTWFYLQIFGEYDPIENNYSVEGYSTLPIIIYWVFYHVWTEYYFGSTLGHALFDLKVMSLNGKKTQFIQNLKRHLLDPIDLHFFGIPAFITINNTTKHQRLGDLWGKTIVLSSKDKILRIFKLRPAEEQEWLITNTWCERCKKADLKLENPSEYEQDARIYFSGFCSTCGRELISEIKTEIIKTTGNNGEHEEPL